MVAALVLRGAVRLQDADLDRLLQRAVRDLPTATSPERDRGLRDALVPRGAGVRVEERPEPVRDDVPRHWRERLRREQTESLRPHGELPVAPAERSRHVEVEVLL